MVKTPRKLGHLVVKVRDLGRSVDFYTGFLGLNVTGQVRDIISITYHQGSEAILFAKNNDKIQVYTVANN